MDVGWHINESQLPSLFKPVPAQKQQLYSQLCDMDIRSYGLPCIADATHKENKAFDGPAVLQLVRYRNTSVPKIKDGSASARDCVIRVYLTDGHQTVSGIFFGEDCPINADTPPGTKLLLNGTITLEGSFLLLNRANTKVLGGRVPQLIEKWNIENSAFRESMAPRKSENTAPKWISFGKRIDPAGAQGASRNFKANDVIKSATQKEKEPGESDDFDKARQETINAAKEEAAGKKFAAPNIAPPIKKEEPRPPREEKPIVASEPRERKGRFSKRGRRGDDDDDDGPVPAEFARPSGPKTLFDFIAPTVGDSLTSTPAPSNYPSHNSAPRDNFFQNDRGSYSGRGRRGGGRGNGSFSQRENYDGNQQRQPQQFDRGGYGRGRGQRGSGRGGGERGGPRNYDNGRDNFFDRGGRNNDESRYGNVQSRGGGGHRTMQFENSSRRGGRGRGQYPDSNSGPFSARSDNRPRPNRGREAPNMAVYTEEFSRLSTGGRPGYD